LIESFSEFFRKNNGVGGPWLITGLCVPPRKRSAAAKQGFAVLAIGDMAARDRLFGFDLWTGNRAASSDLVVCGDYEGGVPFRPLAGPGLATDRNLMRSPPPCDVDGEASSSR